MSSGIYDLDDSKSKVVMLRLLYDLKLEVATLKDLLDKHGSISPMEFESAKKYHASTPEFKQMTDYLNQVEAKITQYKNDPQAHLRDIFNAKMNGQL